MEKKLKIGFVGSQIRMDLIRQMIPERFPEIRIEIYENDRYDYSEEMESDLRAMKNRVDGVVFGGELQFKLYQNLFEPDVLCTCIQKDSASLLNSFLALSWQKANVSRISVDNYTPSTVRIILTDAGIPENHVKILRRRTLGTAGEKYYEELYKEHRRLYMAGEVEGCITTLIFVYNRLAAEGIPVAYSRPTTDNIVATVFRLKQECLARRNVAEGNLAVLAIRVTPKEDIFYHDQSEYIESREKLKAAEELFYFAKNARATVIQQSDEQFTLLMNKADLMNYSNALESMPFLQLLRDNCSCDISLGIGFGFTPGEARRSAGLALKKAIQHDGSCTYVVHDSNSITGPMNFVTPQITQRMEEQEVLQALAEKSGISAAKLYKINLLRERTKKSLFTASELADYLHMSVRGANRMLTALEEHDLVCVSGHTVSGKAGRPKNVYRILFDLE